ncbi:hypothetical protein D3C81_1976960 [compost metagenome]
MKAGSWVMCRSLPQMPQRHTSISTSSAAGTGIATVPNCKGWFRPLNRIACIIASSVHPAEHLPAIDDDLRARDVIRGR